MPSAAGPAASSRPAPMVRKLPNTRCFMPSSRICLRMAAAGAWSPQIPMALAPELAVKSQPPGGVPEFDDAEPAVTVVDAQQRDLGQTQIGVDAPGQRVPLHAVVLERAQIPGDDGLGNGRVRGCGVDDRHLGLEADPKADVGG